MLGKVWKQKEAKGLFKAFLNIYFLPVWKQEINFHEIYLLKGQFMNQIGQH